VLDPHATLPSLLRRQGYTTALVGKFHFPEQSCLQNVNVAKKGSGPDARPLGWDRFVGFWGGVCSHWRRDGWVDERGEKVPDPNPARPGKVENGSSGSGGGGGGGGGSSVAEHTTDFITRHAVRIINEHGTVNARGNANGNTNRNDNGDTKAQPLFLWASYTAPHTPHEAPEALVEGCRCLSSSAHVRN